MSFWASTRVVLDRSYLQDRPEGRRAEPDGLTPRFGTVLSFSFQNASKDYKGKSLLRASFSCAMPSLTDAEKVMLQRAVSEHGRDWDAIVATGALGTRTWPGTR